MGSLSGKPGQIFSYVDLSGKTQKISANYNDSWSDIRTNDKNLNSIFDKADKNGDDIIQAEELNLLNKLLTIADKFFKKTAGNNCIEQEELVELKKQLDEGKIDIEKLEEETLSTGTWSEGIDRNIGKISISNTNKATYLPQVYEELQAIGKEQGFTVDKIESGGDPWVEDSSIRRADNKKYIQYYNNIGNGLDVVEEFESKRANISTQSQGRVSHEGTSADLEIPLDQKYYGTSYLEGGNVLNTIKADGKVGAVVGEESIAYTLAAAEKEKTPENIEWAKQQIATDLGLNVEDVTFIPQFDFHIDMTFRPLHNGQFAVPDFDEAIRILQENAIPSLDESNGSEAQTKKEQLIEKLKELRDKTKPMIDETTGKLMADGYEVVKIPSFTTDISETTNFMNGVGGTSDKTGQSFYITNRSPHTELNDIITKYFQQAGIDKVYFVSTEGALKHMGGIDCLTQESPKM